MPKDIFLRFMIIVVSSPEDLHMRFWYGWYNLFINTNYCKAVQGNWPMACSQELPKNLLHPRTKRTIGYRLLQEDINNVQRSSIDSSCHTTLKFHLTEQSSFFPMFQLKLNLYSASDLQLSQSIIIWPKEPGALSDLQVGRRQFPTSPICAQDLQLKPEYAGQPQFAN